MATAWEQDVTQSYAFSVWTAIGAFLAGASILVRIFSYPLMTSDYTGFLTNWFNTLQTQGIHAFAGQFADYAPLYLYFLKFLTFIPVSSLYSIKSLSIFFDLVLAFFTYRLMRDTGEKYLRDFAFFAAALMFAIPTILINSSVWGQSDSVYAAGVLASFYFLLIRKPLPATIAFALAISVKFQAVFFLPILVGYLLRERSKLVYLLLIPAVFFITLIPALLGGGSLAYWGLIYIKQSGEYPWLSVSAPSVYAYITNLSLGSLQTPLFYAGLAVATIGALFAIGYVAFKKKLTTPQFALITLFCVLVLPYFLPRMHERYFYLADVFSVIYALYVPKRWYIPVLIVLSSFLSYMPYLSGQIALFYPLHVVDLRIPATILLLTLMLLGFQFVAQRMPPERQSEFQELG